MNLCLCRPPVIYIYHNKKNNNQVPGGDPDPLEQLEFPMDENPDDEGLLEFLLTGLALVADDLLASDEEEFTDNDVLK